VPAAPNPLEELVRRPLKNSQELGSTAPGPAAGNRHVADIPAALIVSVNDLIDRATRRLGGS
jgi:hypothetical protein